jgi:hypothetical protein
LEEPHAFLTEFDRSGEGQNMERSVLDVVYASPEVKLSLDVKLSLHVKLPLPLPS